MPMPQWKDASNAWMSLDVQRWLLSLTIGDLCSAVGVKEKG